MSEGDQDFEGKDCVPPSHNGISGKTQSMADQEMEGREDSLIAVQIVQLGESLSSSLPPAAEPEKKREQVAGVKTPIPSEVDRDLSRDWDIKSNTIEKHVNYIFLRQTLRFANTNEAVHVDAQNMGVDEGPEPPIGKDPESRSSDQGPVLESSKPVLLEDKVTSIAGMAGLNPASSPPSFNTVIEKNVAGEDSWTPFAPPLEEVISEQAPSSKSEGGSNLLLLAPSSVLLYSPDRDFSIDKKVSIAREQDSTALHFSDVSSPLLNDSEAAILVGSRVTMERGKRDGNDFGPNVAEDPDEMPLLDIEVEPEELLEPKSLEIGPEDLVEEVEPASLDPEILRPLPLPPPMTKRDSSFTDPVHSRLESQATSATSYSSHHLSAGQANPVSSPGATENLQVSSQVKSTVARSVAPTPIPLIFTQVVENFHLLRTEGLHEEELPSPKQADPWWVQLFDGDYSRMAIKLTPEQIEREARFIEDSLGIEKGGSILDLGCGRGEHAISLAKKGYKLVAYDLSASMVTAASEGAELLSTQIEIVQGDMCELALEEEFDGVYCWNTTFGFFDEERNAQVLQRIHRALKRGGLFLVDVINRDFAAQSSPNSAWFQGDRCVCMDEMHLDWIGSRIKVKRTVMFDEGRVREIEYSIRAYSSHELGRMLHEKGFRVIEVSGRMATPGVFFGADSPRLIVLAEKR